MTKRHLQYLRNDHIEEVTAQRVRQYESKAGISVALPVPVEQIVERVLGLDFDWDVIEEQPGEQILGGLDAANRKILLNEKHSDLFEQNPGLLRSTIGHEAAHFDIDIDRSKQSRNRATRFRQLSVRNPDSQASRGPRIGRRRVASAGREGARENSATSRAASRTVSRLCDM